MTENTCQELVCKDVDQLAAMLRADTYTKVNNKTSVRGKIASITKAAGKAWNEEVIYEQGDIITYSGYIFIARVANQRANPLIRVDAWRNIQNDLDSADNKIMAYCTFKSDLTIIDSYNVTSVTSGTSPDYLNVNITNFTTAEFSGAASVQTNDEAKKRYILNSQFYASAVRVYLKEVSEDGDTYSVVNFLTDGLDLTFTVVVFK